MSTFTDEPVVFPRDRVLQKLKHHPLWTLNEDNKLSRKFRAKNFKSALDFIAAVGAIANKHKHHPDITIRDSKLVEVSRMHR
jgi:pterin-4a-carbinolamine dehydratase